MNFDAWKKIVDEFLLKEVGLESDDMEDWHYRADWEDGLSPQESACDALEHIGYVFR